MRAVAVLLVSGTLTSLAGCDAQPTSRVNEPPKSQALPLYRAISTAFAPCKIATEKSKDVEFRISTTAASKNDGYAAADQQTFICNQTADALTKLGQTSLQSETENAAAEKMNQDCVSDALAKSQSGEAFKLRISIPNRAQSVDRAVNSGGNDGLTGSCLTALAEFAKIAGIAAK